MNPDVAAERDGLLLDIDEKIEAAADDRGRSVIIRRLRRALESEA